MICLIEKQLSHVFISCVGYMQYGINLYWLHGKYQEKMKRSVSQLFMILEGNGGMDKSKKENIYLALFLMFLEFITLEKKKKIRATLQVF